MGKTKGGKKITIYASMGVRRGISDLLWAFRRKYTLEEFPAYLDDHPFPLLKRVEAELKNGLNTADIVMAPHYLLLQMKNRGLLANYSSVAQPSFAYDNSKTWSAIGVTSMFPVNSERIDLEAPERIDELSAKRWKNQIASQAILTSSAGNLTAYYLVALRRILGEKRWKEVIDIVREAKPETYDCIDHLLQALEAGEKSIALAAYSLAFYRLKEEGARLKQLQIDELPRLYTFTSVGLLKGSEDSVSAHHFLDFLFSNEGQFCIGKIWGILPLNSKELPDNWENNFFPTESEVRNLSENSRKLARLGLV